MKHALLSAVCIAAVIGLGLPTRAAVSRASTTNRVNILFLMDDQHRGDWIGAAGAKWLITPNLDRLAREGALFRRGYSSTPSCLPARAGVLTGLSPWNHGVLGYRPIPAHYAWTLPKIFTDAGYTTHCVGKNHFAPKRNTHGYQVVELGEPTFRDGEPADDYGAWFTIQLPGKSPFGPAHSGNDQRGGIPYPFDERLHLAHWDADRAIAFLETNRTGAPWFLKVSFISPHAPFLAPKRWLDRYADADVPPASIGDWARKIYGDVKTSFQTAPEATRGVIAAEEIIQSRRSYGAAISFVDEQIGRILAALEKRGELENTFILLTADHGDVLGDNLLYRKTFSVEGSINIPMIVRWPDRLGLNVKRGQVRNDLAELRDVLPTFIDAAGLACPPAVEGASLLDALRGKSWRTILDLEHGSCYDPKDGWVALMDQRYKYVYYTITGVQQLFDLQNDPHELRDLAADSSSAALVKEWRQRMIKHLASRGENWVRNGDLVVQPKAQLFRPDSPYIVR
jgi:arylsulfatase A-like enzyme